MRKIRKINCIVKPDAGLCNPSNLYFSSKEEALYICDMGNARIVKYFFNSGKLEDICKTVQNEKKLIKPLALTIDNAGNLFVTDVQHNCVFKYLDGGYSDIYINLGLSLPGSITSGEEGSIYISDFHHNQIVKWLPTNKSFVLKDIPCSKMYGICCKFPYLYITDTGNNRIVRYHVLREQSETISWSGIAPIAIVVSDENTIYVSENRRIFYLFSFGQCALLLDRNIWMQYKFERLGHIGAITIGDKNRLFFSDTIKNCIYEIIMQ